MSGFSSEAIAHWGNHHVAPGSRLRSDSWPASVQSPQRPAAVTLDQHAAGKPQDQPQQQLLCLQL